MDDRKIITLEDNTNLHIIPTDDGVVFDRYDKDNEEVLESGWVDIAWILELIH